MWPLTLAVGTRGATSAWKAIGRYFKAHPARLFSLLAQFVGLMILAGSSLVLCVYVVYVVFWKR